MKKLISETIIYGMGAILPRVINFAMNRFYIDKFDNSEAFAQFANLYAIISFVNVLLSFGFETSFFRFSAEKENRNKAFYTSFWFLFGMASVFLIGILLFKTPVANYLDYADHPEYIVWFALIAFFDTLCVIPFAWLRFNNMPYKYSGVRIGQMIIQLTLVLLLFLVIPTSFSESLGIKTKVAYPFFSNLTASVFGFIFLLPVVAKVKLEFYQSLFKKMIKYSYPVMLAGLAFMVNENFDKIIQFHHIPKSDAGAYAGCYKLAVLMTLFVTAYRMGVEPFFFKEMDKANAKETYAKVTEYFTFFTSIMAMGLIANISWLKELFIPNKTYWIAMDVVPIVIIANLCFGIYYNLSTWYKVTDQTKYGTLISWVGALVTIAINYLLIDKYGFMVSAWATFAAYFTMMILSYYLGQKHYTIPYRVSKISGIFIALIICSYLSYVVFDANYFIGNIIFVLFVTAIGISERKFIKKYIK